MNQFLLKSFSDNQKSAIQNRKWVGLFAVVVALTVCGARVEAQQPEKIPRIGFLQRRVPPTSTSPDPLAEAFRQGRRELGYIDGKNIQIEHRYGAGSEDRLRGLIDELIQIKVDLLVIPPSQGIRAAKQATTVER